MTVMCDLALLKLLVLGYLGWESQETGWNESLQNLMIGDSISNQHPTSFPLGTVPAGKDGNIKSPKVAEVHIHIVCMYRYVPIKTDTQT